MIAKRETNEIAMMDAAEARDKTERIRTNLTEARRLLLEMYEREGWKALGYESWREYGQAEFDYSESRVYELMNAAKVERNLSAMAEKPIPERHLRPLTKLPKEKQGEAWQRAVETAPNGRVTGMHVEKTVEEISNGGRPHVSHNSGNNEWYTPREYIDAARVVMGEIDLDPASSPEANSVVCATDFYTIADDGLAMNWYGRVWMNPPYAADLVGQFTAKLASHYAAADVSQAIALVNNATETAWFRELAIVASAIVFPASRVKFWRPDGEIGAPLQGQAILYMGAEPRRFLNVFCQFGWGAMIDG